MQGSKGSEKYLKREPSTEDVSGMLEVFNYYIVNSFAAYTETKVGPEYFQAVQSEKEQNKNEQFPFTLLKKKAK